MMASSSRDRTESLTDRLKSAKEDIETELDMSLSCSKSEICFTAQEMKQFPAMDDINKALMTFVEDIRSFTKKLLNLFKKNDDLMWFQVENYLNTVQGLILKQEAYVSMVLEKSSETNAVQKEIAERFQPFENAKTTADEIAKILARAGISRPIRIPRGHAKKQKLPVKRPREMKPTNLPKKGDNLNKSEEQKHLEAKQAKVMESSTSLTSTAAGTGQNTGTANNQFVPEDESGNQAGQLPDGDPMEPSPKRKLNPKCSDERQHMEDVMNAGDENDISNTSEDKEPKTTPEISEDNVLETTPEVPKGKESETTSKVPEDVITGTEPIPEEQLDVSSSEPEKRTEEDKTNDGLFPPKITSYDEMVTLDRRSDQFIQCLRTPRQESFFNGDYALLEYDNSNEFLEDLSGKQFEDVALINHPDETFRLSTVDCSLDTIYQPDCRKTLKKPFKDNAFESVERSIESFMTKDIKGLNYIMRNIGKRKVPFKTPDFVEKISIHSLIEEKSKRTKVSELKSVENFLVFSLENSLMDIRPDMCATAKYYYVHKGAMVLFVGKSTESNLKIYEEWISSGNLSKWIVGKLDGVFSRFEVGESKTVVIPPGILHFIFFPVSSTLVGGSFLTVSRLKYSIQLTDLQQRESEYDTDGIGRHSKDVWKQLYYFADSCMENIDDATRKALCHALQEPSRLNSRTCTGLSVPQKKELMRRLNGQYFSNEPDDGNESDASDEIA